MIRLPQTRGGFRVILADPTWAYSNKKTRSAAADNYATMTLAELSLLPVADIAAKDPFLFMWATCPFLKTAIALGESWGFKYKTVGFWWAKRNRKANSAFFGMGNYTRANGEPCLLFTRGSPKVAARNVNQFVWSPIRRHSEKPAEVRDLIVKLCGDAKRVELFSRHEVSGWRRWGNQIL